jgi:hypothetical protein
VFIIRMYFMVGSFLGCCGDPLGAAVYQMVGADDRSSTWMGDNLTCLCRTLLTLSRQWGRPLAPAGVAEIPNDAELRFKTDSIGLKKLVVRVPARYDLALSRTIRGYDNDSKSSRRCTRRSRSLSTGSSRSSIPRWTAWSRTSWPRGCRMKPNPLISLEISWSASDLKGACGA